MRRASLLGLLVCTCIHANTYYISNRGNDSNDGMSSGTAWKTIGHVSSSSLQPGDSVLFEAGGIWAEQLTIPNSGTFGNPITFGSYGTGALPIIDGSDEPPSWTEEAQAPGKYVFYAPASTAPNQVLENDMRMTAAHSKASMIPGSFWFDAASRRIYIRTFEDASPLGQIIEVANRSYAVSLPARQYITIRGLELRGANLHGLYDVDNSNVSGLKLIGNKIDSNYEHGVYIDDGADMVNDVVIASNSFVNNGASGFQGIAHQQRGWVIVNNVADRNAQIVSTSGEFQFTAGIRVGCGYGDGTTYPGPELIAGNTSTNNGPTAIPGFSSYSNGVGIWIDSCNNVNITGNSTSGNWGSGEMLEKGNNVTLAFNMSNNDDVYGVKTNDPTDAAGIWVRVGEGTNATGNIIYNNTVYGGDVAFNISSYDGSTVSNTLVENNLFIQGAAYSMYIGPGGNNDGARGSGNVYRFNGLGAASTKLAYWTGSGSIASYLVLDRVFGAPMNNMHLNPGFVNKNTGDFSLLENSPARHAGIVIGSASFGGNPDLGAVPFGRKTADGVPF